MGFFDFVKDAGKSLWGGDDEAEAAEAIEKEVKDLGLEGDVQIKVDGDTVKIAGMAPSQEIKEKIILAAGNVAGIGKVEEEIGTDEAADPAVFHTVAKGDTLWAIAEKHYGNGSKYAAIFEANRPMLSDPDKIYPGQVLRIPAH
ncbi:nucleoid-associated protein YgaU [Rhodobium orientis]|uniref:Potassium binding protein Kbp n=1 Tax=Rhodobium orientis TaxID=34017 RepID=A0A327JT79_9HYPH|nr:peptidoglycan-binding protein LysM [Rhodobium orientis]MBB4304330.1 nucleoid-associated protein YgaU [Rhodobium orientis]MBK5948176.1 peptidoglycan-binding protein LysM [Rhodobium orientis]RAI28825.1 peptidoglycan-binding protein LysM [Rhodobium orientis]